MSEDYMGGLTGSVQEMEEERKAVQPKIETYTDDLGKLRYKIDAAYEQVQEIMAGARAHAETIKGFARQNLERAQKIRQDPWANIATTIAGSLAAGDPKMPGWVQGLGKASLALNPTPDVLERRAAEYGGEALQAQLAGIRPLEHMVGLEGAYASRVLTAEQKRAALEQRKKEAEDKAAKAEADVYLKKLTTASHMIEASKGDINPQTFKAMGLKDEDIQMLQSEAKGVKEAETVRREAFAQRQALAKRKEDWDEKMDKARLVIMEGRAKIEQQKAQGMTEPQLRKYRQDLEKQREALRLGIVKETDRYLIASANIEAKLAPLTDSQKKAAGVEIQAINAGINQTIQTYREQARAAMMAIDQEIATIDARLGGATPPPTGKPAPAPVGEKKKFLTGREVDLSAPASGPVTSVDPESLFKYMKD